MKSSGRQSFFLGYFRELGLDCIARCFFGVLLAVELKILESINSIISRRSASRSA